MGGSQSHPLNIPNLDGKVAIVTGGTNGLGLHSAIELAYAGAHVIITARNEARGEEALKLITDTIAKRTADNAIAGEDEPNNAGTVEYGIADQEDLASVAAFAEWFLRKQLPLHVLMCNAGVALVAHKVVDGIESHMLINHLAHFLLVTKLLPVLKASSPSRIVFVASDAHMVTDSNILKTPEYAEYSAIRTYGNSKLANILTTRALARRLDLDTDRIFVNVVHPGIVPTGIMHKVNIPKFLPRLAEPVMRRFLAGPETAVMTQLYAAVSPEIENLRYHGQYFIPTAQLSHPSNSLISIDLEEELWAWSIQKLEAAKVL